MAAELIVMRRKIAALVLVTSVAGGVAAGVAASALTPGSPSAAPAATPVATTPQAPVDDVEVRDAELVHNRDGSATLSATLVNHTDKALEINNAKNGQSRDYDAPQMLLWGDRQHITAEPDVPLRIGGVGDGYRLRTAERVQVGSTLPVTIELIQRKNYDGQLPRVTFTAPVVARTGAHADVANNGPNSDISAHDAVIVVVPGQEKAYIGGWFESTIDDQTSIRPTVDPELGPGIEILHQTATGGPSGFFAQAGKQSPLGYAPYLENPGDADYVRASEVTIGQKIKVTFRFPSGDVVAKFKVVQGNPDGTIAS